MTRSWHGSATPSAGLSLEGASLGGLVIFRWGAWVRMAATLALSQGQVRRPSLAVALVGAALGLTAAYTVVWRRRPQELLRPTVVGAELVLALALIVCDGAVRETGAVFQTGQSVGSVFPVVGVLSAGVAFGPRVGALTGVLGFGRMPSAWLNGVTEFDTARTLSIAYGVVFYALAGAVAGYVFVRMQRAERDVAAARAREEVARTLHDGVLQTLAIVERRADDPALARLAREQERELREFLFGQPHAVGALEPALRAAAARFEDTFDGRAEVVTTGELPSVRPEIVEALAGAVGEALTNAGRHGDARHVVIYVDHDGDGLFCSVKDDGRGVDPSAMVEGVGMSRSIRGRVADHGGRVELAAVPGEGMEVRLWLPV